MESNRSTTLLAVLAGGGLVVLVFKLAQPVVLTIAVSVVLAYIMDPLMMLLRRRVGLPVWLAILTTAIVFGGIFTGLGTVMYTNLVSFARAFPKYQEALFERLKVLMSQSEILVPAQLGFDPLAELRRLPIAGFLLWSVRKVLAVGVQFLAVYFFAVLFLVEKYFLPRKLVRVFHTHRASRIPIIVKHIDQNMRKYIGVKTLISLLVAGLSTVTLILFGLEYAVIWGVLTFLLNYVPSVGSITSALLPFVFSFAQYGGTPTPYWILLTLSALQFATGNVLEPYFMGDTLNLSL